MKNIFLYIFCFFSAVSYSQNFEDWDLDTAWMSNYEFIEWDSVRFKSYSEFTTFDQIIDKMERIQAGENVHLNIYHIGGSHIQADVYSNFIRNYLHNVYPGCGGNRGFIYPYKVAKTNNPFNYRVSLEGEWEGGRCSVYKDTLLWGLSGVTGGTTDSLAKIELDLDRKDLYRFDSDTVKIFYKDWDSVYTWKVEDTSFKIMEHINGDFQTLVFASDEPKELINLELVKNDSGVHRPIQVLGLQFTSRNDGITYNSIGANGASFRSYDRCELFYPMLRTMPPDLFIMSIGTNDAYMSASKYDSLRYATKLTNMMDSCIAINPNCTFVLTVPNDSYYRRKYKNPNTRVQQHTIEAIAKKYNCVVWDFFEIMGGLGSAQNWYKQKLMPYDRIHFTRKGYRIKANLFIRAMENYRRDYLRKKEIRTEVQNNPTEELNAEQTK
jgi:lysophospholipase L1-like esterase